jgi:hypothetical protein
MRFKLATEEATTMKLPTFRSTPPPPAEVTLREGTRRLRAEALPERGLAKTLSGVGIRQSDGVEHSVHMAVKMKRAQRLALITSGCIAAGVWMYVAYTNINPNMPEIVRVMPKVNAYNTYVNAAALLTNTQGIDDTTKLLTTVGDGSLTAEQLKTMRLIVNSNEKVLELLQKGMGQKYMQPLPTGHLWEVTPPEYLQYSTVRTYSRLLRLKAEVAKDEGKLADAASTALDTVQMGNQMAAGAPAVGRITGNTVSSFGRKTLWGLVDKVDAETAKSIANRLAKIEADTIPMSHTLEAEGDATRIQISSIFKSIHWRQYFTGTTSYDGSESQTSLGNRLYFYRYSKTYLWNAYNQRLAEELEHVNDLPTEITAEHEQSGDMFITYFMPMFTGVKFRSLVNSVENRLLVVEFAKRAYFLEHGKYPASLHELAPKYLASVPTDPFRPGHALGYSFTADTPVVYSVGPDQLDEGGRSFARNPSSPEQARQSVELNSRGDIVARIDQN